jgi:hypothetical protein
MNFHKWQTTVPPKDGKTIVAIGRLIHSDYDCTVVEPFVLAMEWRKTESGYEGWMHFRGGLAVAHCPEDEVQIDYWNEYP